MEPLFSTLQPFNPSTFQLLKNNPKDNNEAPTWNPTLQLFNISTFQLKENDSKGKEEAPTWNPTLQPFNISTFQLTCLTKKKNAN
jgi:hypothetical protein